MTATKKMTAKQIVAASYAMAADADVIAEARAKVSKYPGLNFLADPAPHIEVTARSVVRRSYEEQIRPVRDFAVMIAAHRVATA